MRLRPILALAALALLTLPAGCSKLDDKRIPPMVVRVVFNTVGDWNAYGISGALSTRSFIKSEKVPSNYPYTSLSATGFGGVLLVGQFNYSGDPLSDPPRAYDLACPVEVKASVRIEVDRENHVGRCPVCGSTYDIFNYGAPLSGPAQQNNYGLRRYKAGPGPSGEYLLISY